MNTNTVKSWRQRRSRRGSAIVEVLVIVGVVLTLGLLAMSTIGTASTTEAAREADCIRTLACGPGNGGGSGGGGGTGAIAGGTMPATDGGSGNGGSDQGGSSVASLLADLARGAVMGDYAEGGSAAARVTGQILAGLIPGVGLAADVRDFTAALRDYREGRPGSGTGLILASVGFLPLGDAAKLLRRGDELAEAAARAGRAGRALSVDDLSRAAAAPDRGGLTAAGRALQKHGGRDGSAFPAARGNPNQINGAGQKIVDDILTNPGSTTTTRHHARFGDVIEIRAPDGRGLRYDADGKFIGFLEP
jgi:hypothetical protein